MIFQHLLMLTIIIIVVWMLIRICVLQPLGVEGQSFQNFFSGMFRFGNWVLKSLLVLIRAIWTLVKYLIVKPFIYLLKVLYRTIKFLLTKK